MYAKKWQTKRLFKLGGLLLLLFALTWGLRAQAQSLKTTEEPTSDNARAIAISAPYDQNYSFLDLGSPPGVPTQLGGLLVSPDDPNTLLIGGAANTSSGAMYAIGITRDSSGQITGYSGTATRVQDLPFIDGGLVYAPNGTLLSSGYNNNHLYQTLPGNTTPDTSTNLSPLGVTSSIGSFSFVPDGFPGAGQFKVISYNGSDWFDVELTDTDQDGLYTVGTVTPGDTGFRGPEGIAYVPPGSPQFTDHTSVLISEYGTNTVGAYDVDANGDAIASTRRDFMTGVNGAEGATIDPVGGGFLFTTFGSANTVIVVNGFAPATSPSLSVSKTVDNAMPLSGDVITYTVTVSNTGTGAATNVALTDNLPTGMTLVSTDGCADDPNGLPICSIGEVAASTQVAVTYQVSITASAGETLTNTASVTSTEVTTPITDDATVTVTAPNLTVEITVSDPTPQPGDTITYTVTMTNSGNAPATNVSISDVLPSGLTFVRTTGCAEDPSGVPTCSVGDIAADTTKVALIVATIDDDVTPETPITYTVIVSCPEIDPPVTEDVTVTIAVPDDSPQSDSLQIVAFTYQADPTDGEPNGNLDGFIMIKNVGAEPISLDGYKVGDEETQGGDEGMFALPDMMLAAGDAIIIAEDADSYTYGTPDYSFADNSQGVPTLTAYSAWATGAVDLDNASDEVLLIGDTDQLVDGACYGVGDETCVFLTHSRATNHILNDGRLPDDNPAVAGYVRLSPTDTDMQVDWAVDVTAVGLQGSSAESTASSFLPYLVVYLLICTYVLVQRERRQ